MVAEKLIDWWYITNKYYRHISHMALQNRKEEFKNLIRVKNLIRECYKLKYVRCNNKNSPNAKNECNEFETAVENILKTKCSISEHKFKQSDCNKLVKLKNLGLDRNKMYYLKQPFGSQKPPDFIVLIDNMKPIQIECKCSKTMAPMWNCTYPKSDIIYLFNCGKIDKTFLFIGSHINDEYYGSEITELIEEIRTCVKKFETKMNEHFTKNGKKNMFSFYSRNMFNQKAFRESQRKQFFIQTMKHINALFDDDS